MNIALQKGLLDWVPNGIVYCLLAAPPVTWLYLGLTHDRVKNYVRRTKKGMALATFILLGATIGAMIGWGIYGLLHRSIRIAEKRPAPETASPPTTTQTDKAITDLGARLDKLTDAITRNPSVEAEAKLPVLREEYDRLAKQKDRLTTEQQEILQDQELTLKSLEDGRKKHLETQELGKRQSELAQRRMEIEKEENAKQAEKAREPQELAFAKQYGPIINYAITTLHQMLEQIAEQSGEPVTSDFLNKRPSLYSSKILKDNKIVSAQHVIGVGSNKEWQFTIAVLGPPDPRYPPLEDHRFNLSVRAGRASVNMTSSPKQPASLRLSLWVDPPFPQMRSRYDKPVDEQDCFLTDYKKPIEHVLRELIQSRYIDAPLKPKQP